MPTVLLEANRLDWVELAEKPMTREEPAFESVDTWNRDREARRTASAPANSAARPRRHTIGNGDTATSSG
jgi:hypothetical protein